MVTRKDPSLAQAILALYSLMATDVSSCLASTTSGGAGKTGSTDSDVTYATPFYWLLERIKTHFPNASLYQVMTYAS